IQLLPMPSSYCSLSSAYNLIEDRAKADQTIREAARRWPHDFSIRRALDYHEAHPDTGVKQVKLRPLLIVLTAACFLLALWGYKITEADPGFTHGVGNEIVATAGLLARFGVVIFAILACLIS